MERKKGMFRSCPLDLIGDACYSVVLQLIQSVRYKIEIELI